MLMPFPVSIRGQFAVVRSSAHSDARASVVSEAEDLFATRSDNVEVIGQTVTAQPSFLAWFSAGSNWHPMIAFDNMKITVTGTETEAIVFYELSTVRMLSIVGLMSCGVIVFVEATSLKWGGPLANLGTALEFAAGAFSWLFGVNFVLGWIRGPRWLKANLS